jgi:hypothetical protein
MTPDELYSGMQNNTWGMEVEGGTPSGGMTRSDAARVVYEAFRTRWPQEPDMPPITVSPPVATESKIRVSTSDPLDMFPALNIDFVHDGSIPYPNDIEVNSPIYVWRKEHIRHWRTVMRALRDNGFRVGGELPPGRRRCGIHVHIGSKHLMGPHLRNLVFLVWTWELYIRAAVNPWSERLGYMLPLTEHTSLAHLTTNVGDALVQSLKQLERTVRGRNITDEEVSDVWYRVFAGGDPRYKYHTSRYHGLNLHSHWFRHTVEFRWYNSTTYWNIQTAYIQLAYALVLNAAAASRMSAKRKEYAPASAKYDFRVLLLRLGLIGDRFATAREHLLKYLPGSAAWKHGTAEGAQQ